MVKKCTNWEFRGWTNIIAYKMGSSHVGVYTMAKTPPMKNFKHGWKNDMATNMATFIVRGVLQRSSFLSKLNPPTRNLTFGELQLEWVETICEWCMTRLVIMMDTIEICITLILDYVLKNIDIVLDGMVNSIGRAYVGTQR
jgi:hypothetical protein